jgi:TolA-binding protein
MKTRFVYFIFVLFCFACGGGPSDNTPLGKEIAALEKATSGNSDAAKLNDLQNKYLQYYKDHPENRDFASSYLRKGAYAAMQTKNWPQAIGFFQTLLREYYDENESKNDIEDLISVFEKMNKPGTTNNLKQIYVEAHPSSPLAAEYKKVLPEDAPAMSEVILNIGKQMFDDSLKTLVRPKAAQYVDACEALALINPSHPEAPELLYKAAETAKAMGSYPKALTLYDWIIKRYPKYENAPMALFLKGFIFENDLKETEQARKIYESFLETYPDHAFADQTKFLLKHLGKSAEEILKTISPDAEK